jgi:hypothetical protein
VPQSWFFDCCFFLGEAEMKPTRQQVLGSIFLAALVLATFVARARHILVR